jgi:hypothetical protein
MTEKKQRAQTKQAFIINAWKQMDRESVGASELEVIQRAIAGKFGYGAVESPASIARTLADHGARLRHPEILACDTRWRENQAFGLFAPGELDFTTVEAASSSVEKLDALRRQFEQENDTIGLEQLRDLVLQIKRELKLLGRAVWTDESTRDVSQEVVQWLTVWLQNPLIFGDWLSLRRRSSDFLKKFEL